MTQPESPLPPGYPRSHAARVQHRSRPALIVGAIGLLLVLLISYIRYEVAHDLPNPSWGIFGTSYTYTFEDGPPGVGLVETRPDEIVSRYIHDYIGVAGTFPCVVTLATYGDDPFAPDPVRSGKPCTVHRPVAAVHIGTTRVSTFWRILPVFSGSPEAYVSYRIDYADGEHLERDIHLIGDREGSQPYFRTSIHVKCWFSLDTWAFYPNIVAQPPRGVEYNLPHDANTLCAGFE